MTFGPHIYRLHSITDGAPHDTRYFADRAKAEAEGEDLAAIFRAMYHRALPRHDVNRYGLLVVWVDEAEIPGFAPQFAIRLEEGVIET